MSPNRRSARAADSLTEGDSSCVLLNKWGIAWTIPRSPRASAAAALTPDLGPNSARSRASAPCGSPSFPNDRAAFSRTCSCQSPRASIRPGTACGSPNSPNAQAACSLTSSDHPASALTRDGTARASPRRPKAQAACRRGPGSRPSRTLIRPGRRLRVAQMAQRLGGSLHHAAVGAGQRFYQGRHRILVIQQAKGSGGVSAG